jgi:hypothetical protein
MALINSQHIRRVDIPHEPGEWVEIRPVTAGQYADLQRDGADLTGAEVALRILVGSLADWSYDAPITPETLRSLDYETFTWLERELSVTSGLRSDPESNGSVPQSSPITEPATGDSPTSSSTSEKSPGLVSSTS